jgi:hypothetical protein
MLSKGGQANPSLLADPDRTISRILPVFQRISKILIVELMDVSGDESEGDDPYSSEQVFTELQDLSIPFDYSSYSASPRDFSA